MNNAISYIALGLTAGIFSGVLGLGGGVILIPAMLYFFKLSQPEAQGTTLALMVPPIGLLAAWTYYKRGCVDVPMAAFICLGFFFGGLIGAKVAVNLHPHTLKKMFGFALLFISLRIILSK